MFKKLSLALIIIFSSVNLFAGSFNMLLNPKDIYKKDFLIIDARNSLNFIKGHIKGAIHFDGGCSGEICHKINDIPCILKPMNEIREILLKKGICPDKKIVIYGDENSWGAEGRIFWLLDKLGYKKIAILNGGYNYWKNKNLPVSFGISLFSKKISCENRKLNSFKLITAEDIYNKIKKNKAIIIDTRTKKEFNGAILYGEKRGGHIPSSIFINWKEFLNNDYTLKDKEQILKILQDKGIPLPEKLNKEIITICTGGVRSGFVYFVLKYAGYKFVENYDNGFWEWAASNFPVEK